MKGSLLCALQFTWIAAGVLTLVFCIIWPVMTIPAGVFSLGYFYWFVILSLCWGLVRPLPTPKTPRCNDPAC